MLAAACVPEDVELLDIFEVGICEPNLKQIGSSSQALSPEIVFQQDVSLPSVGICESMHIY